ncbi:uncharacterized protein CYBJADRAFT_160649 [Cyberlindnera jadinii NRRL Y-1542]|uniref:Uncharacterized protein n=1 Tax=Cyberlindnera jadinii (strain ATCC 18201 / CBS 1600 / BCRC 20928 / JCM 3617 / NBRC 0987 / NRRL Y-1542) TaxID=983966 RepID=A0A1E4S6U8_CYBJN|nr:hypothetical protein CYBJADRAFT_160649 [Cyberlindnera jadinii NRRL Y-1542]ODV75200.1 hypothetical protein CYBJADRAFT_160649 [Cyberlindnera jadinii NRRL Y-1542]
MRVYNKKLLEVLSVKEEMRDMEQAQEANITPRVDADELRSQVSSSDSDFSVISSDEHSQEQSEDRHENGPEFSGSAAEVKFRYRLSGDWSEVFTDENAATDHDIRSLDSSSSGNNIPDVISTEEDDSVAELGGGISRCTSNNSQRGEELRTTNKLESMKEVEITGNMSPCFDDNCNSQSQSLSTLKGSEPGLNRSLSYSFPDPVKSTDTISGKDIDLQHMEFTKVRSHNGLNLPSWKNIGIMVLLGLLVFDRTIQIFGADGPSSKYIYSYLEPTVDPPTVEVEVDDFISLKKDFLDLSNRLFKYASLKGSEVVTDQSEKLSHVYSVGMSHTKAGLGNAQPYLAMIKESLSHGAKQYESNLCELWRATGKGAVHIQTKFSAIKSEVLKELNSINQEAERRNKERRIFLETVVFPRVVKFTKASSESLKKSISAFSDAAYVTYTATVVPSAEYGLKTASKKGAELFRYLNTTVYEVKESEVFSRGWVKTKDYFAIASETGKRGLGSFWTRVEVRKEQIPKTMNLFGKKFFDNMSHLRKSIDEAGRGADRVYSSVLRNYWRSIGTGSQ